MNLMKQDAMDDKIKERCKTCEKQCMQEEHGSSNCWAAIEQKPTLMDWTAIENLLSIQKLPQWIEKLSRMR